MYRQQMGMGGAGANPMAAMAGGDPNKALEAERAALDLVRARCVPSAGLIRFQDETKQNTSFEEIAGDRAA